MRKNIPQVCNNSGRLFCRNTPLNLLNAFRMIFNQVDVFWKNNVILGKHFFWLQCSFLELRFIKFIKVLSSWKSVTCEITLVIILKTIHKKKLFNLKESVSSSWNMTLNRSLLRWKSFQQSKMSFEFKLQIEIEWKSIKMLRMSFAHPSICYLFYAPLYTNRLHTPLIHNPTYCIYWI